MIKYAINLNTVVPVRAKACEQSEMVTQLLFGDLCRILDEENSFSKIENQTDTYQGWVDTKMLTQLSANIFEAIQQSPLFMTCSAIADAYCLTDRSIYHLSAGSRLPFYNLNTNSFTVEDITFQIHSSFVSYMPKSSKTNIIASAMLFLNTPYLWGGKNIFGIDCSGLVQTVFDMNGFSLTRDASTQSKEGQAVTDFSEAQTTDLMFFEKEGKINHVGIYLGDGKIIHSSGKVKIEQINEIGIINKNTEEYSHRLAVIRRM